MSSSYYNERNLDKVIWRVNDSPSNFTLMICCTETVRVVPRISVCNDYHVPVTPKQAEAFLRGRLGIDVELENLNTIFDTHIKCLPHARRIQAMMTGILMQPWNRYKYKPLLSVNGYDTYKKEMERVMSVVC